MKARLIRAHGLAEELVDRVQVDRQAEHASAHRGFHPVDIGHEAGKAVHIGPHALVVGVEDVGAVDVHHHAAFGIARGVAIARYMVALVDHQHAAARLGQLARDHRARKPRAHDQHRPARIALHHPHCRSPFQIIWPM
jgi:hypothetical protein